MRKKRMSFWLAGGLAGLANGLFGGGGGSVLVPLLTRGCGLDQRKAFATSVAVILPLCVLSVAIYFFRGGLDWRVALAAAILLVIVTLVTDFIALGTITVSVAGPVGLWIAGSGLMVPLILAVATVVMIFKHRDNIARIRNKQEIGLISTIKGENRVK